jgi:anti-sigma regulatory factor (Ser/Thr protein kinase)
MLLAVSEAVENVVLHAYPPTQDPAPEAAIELTLWVDDTEVVVAVADHGLWVPPQTTVLEHDSTAAPARHGRGIILMNTHVDQVAIRHHRDGTTVLLRCALGDGDRA